MRSDELSKELRSLEQCKARLRLIGNWTAVHFIMLGFFGLQIFPVQGYADPVTATNHLDAKEVERALKWIGPASKSPDEPWFVCLRLRGAHLLYQSKLFGIQARYRSWTAEWRRHRPQGYATDEGVGLITDQELASLFVRLESVAAKASLTHSDVDQLPPCDPDIEDRRVEKSPHELVAELWLRRPPSLEEGPKWRLWTFLDPHLQTAQAPREMIDLIERQIYAVAEEQIDLDLLLSPGQSGSLYLQVSQASEVWVDGVYRGRWPSVNPIKLSEGKYHLRVAPLDRRYDSVVFEDLEVLADKKTKFGVELELSQRED